jgi:hypothetical protein
MFTKTRAATFNTIGKTVVLESGNLTVTDDRTAYTIAELENAALDYAAKVTTPLIPMASDKTLALIRSLYKKSEFIAVIKYKNNVVGALIANTIFFETYQRRCTSLEYYNSTLTGYLSARALILAHRAMLIYANKTSAEYAITSCFYKDEKHTFNKILTKDGWQSQGYMSVYDLRS